MSSRYNIGDILGGGFLIIVGLWFAVAAYKYNIGTLLNMGPGYFPRMVGVVTILIGLAIVLTSRRGGAELAMSWRAFGAIAASIVVFGVLLVPFGLIPATFAATCAAAYADPASRPVGTLILATILSVAMSIIFIYALSLPLVAIRGPF